MAVFNQNLDRAFVLFKFTLENEISFLDSYEKTLSKCCNDPLSLRDYRNVAGPFGIRDEGASDL